MNKLFSLLLVAIVASCASNEPSKPSDDKNNNLAIANKLFENFNLHKWDAMAALYKDTASFKDPSFGTTVVKQTRQQTIAKYEALNKIFLDIKDSVVAMYPSGQKYITVEFISKGTAPDGSKFELPICAILTVENGLITSDYTYYDNSGNK